MTFYSDKVENFLAGASINYDHSGYEATTTMFSAADQSSTSGSKISHVTLTNSDPLFSSLREWLDCRSQCLPDEEVLNESNGLIDAGLQFVEMAASALETVVQNKEDLRHCFKVPLTANVLPLHYNQHKNFIDMVQCLGEVGNKYEDYSMISTDKVVSSVHQFLDKLESAEKKVVDVQKISIITAADIEEVRNKF
ncbi:uncharacterized protein LOC124337477 [Daphnia pulicaria]|uniref:uncharacterized protein LOC124337477 n=1 Tax=Daphnia pulicaria TaxID=35523 RepID=UPI001EEBBAE9|nr:uncharacterized protein LOC124337477 [Daphnia pulicaria]